ncbi:MAG: glycosyltransferase family 2 protein [Aggregatilineales bacterium]
MSTSVSPPSVSIVMPTYNRAHFLDRCLPPLLAQSYPLNRYDLILVDDGSTDDTVSRANELARGWQGKFNVVQKPNGGAASARNAGWRASNADVIAFIDSDCVAGPDWLKTLLTALRDANADGVGGPIVGGDIDNHVARYLEASQMYRHRVRNGQVDYLITGNVAFSRTALAEVGGFKDMRGAGGEDPDLSFQLRDHGHKLTVTDDLAAAVTHYGTPSSVRALAHNLYRYGYNNYRLSRTWSARRSPVIQLARHSGAIVLSPWIVLRLTRRISLGQAVSFWPLVVIEHGAFVAGMLAAIPHGRVQ